MNGKRKRARTVFACVVVAIAPVGAVNANDPRPHLDPAGANGRLLPEVTGRRPLPGGEPKRSHRPHVQRDLPSFALGDAAIRGWAEKRLDQRCASFDKLRTRGDISAITGFPHAEPVEARTTFIPSRTSAVTAVSDDLTAFAGDHITEFFNRFLHLGLRQNGS